MYLVLEYKRCKEFQQYLKIHVHDELKNHKNSVDPDEEAPSEPLLFKHYIELGKTHFFKFSKVNFDIAFLAF